MQHEGSMHEGPGCDTLLLGAVTADQVRNDRKKETKHDNLVKVSSLLNEVRRGAGQTHWHIMRP